MQVAPGSGLDSVAVGRRRQQFGVNRLYPPQERSLFSLLLAQFENVVVLLLCVAALLAFAFGDVSEAAAIAAVIFLNAGIGFVSEWRATRSMEALRQMGQVETLVIRDGQRQRLPAEELVPGDIVLREAGDIVTADLRLLEAANLQCNEAALTGESLPVSKRVEPVHADAPLGERFNMLYKGTEITRGTAAGVVVTTGFGTELGRVAELVDQASDESTPLEKRIDALGGRLVRLAAGLALLVAAAGAFVGRDPLQSIEVGIALAVAAIPEGLPVVATIALARGMWRMAKRNALISRLSAVETLGTTSLIATDKTGTLTENRMTLTEFRLPGVSRSIEELATAGDVPDALPGQLEALLQVAVLCSNAALRDDITDWEHATGDPTEVALLMAAERLGVRQSLLQARWPKQREEPFDTESKMMATVHAVDDGVLVAVKGAPEAVISRCTRQLSRAGEAALDEGARARARAAADDLGRQGLRTLALARRVVREAPAALYEDLTLLGIVGIEDPAREGIAEAVAQCRRAGIRIVMLTGDHAATARQIAIDTGIVAAEDEAGSFVDGVDLRLDAAGVIHSQARVISRVTPEQKLGLVRGFQAGGHVVAMTGDGVNDAPALRQADIGIAMGIRGTPVARQAADMILLDDNFESIVEAVAQGRAIYENIRKFVVYLVSCNISEILIVLLATLAGAPLPLLPLQILFLNLVTDVFPALALGVGRGSPTLMTEGPRPSDEPLLTRRHWAVILAHGLVISAAVLGAMAVAVLLLGADGRMAVTVSFSTLAFAQLWHVVNMRRLAAGLFDNEITRNPWIWVAIGICVGMLLGAIYLPAAARLLELVPPGTEFWLLILAASLLPVLLGSGVRRLARRFVPR